jgi:hypothetical protein
MNPEWRYIWVDAICIDQKNVQERNEQVLIMDGVFSNASLVVAWLGLEDETVNWQAYVPMECLSYDDRELESKAVELACRPFWNRRWVVQELLLAINIEISAADTESLGLASNPG